MNEKQEKIKRNLKLIYMLELVGKIFKQSWWIYSKYGITKTEVVIWKILTKLGLWKGIKEKHF